MALRKPLDIDLPEAVSEADVEFRAKRFVSAFKSYKLVFDSSIDSHMQLYCKAMMFFCQYEKRTINSRVAIERACLMLPELAVVIQANHPLKMIFEYCVREVQQILDILESPEKSLVYLASSAVAATKRSNDDRFRHHIDLMELSSTNQAYEADYLNALYVELKETSLESHLKAELAEATAGAYSNCAEDSENPEQKKQRLDLAKEYYERAMQDWRDAEVEGRADEMFSFILYVMQERYVLIVKDKNDDERVRLYRAIEKIINCKEYASLADKTKDKHWRRQIEAERFEYQAWLQEAAKEMAKEKRPELDALLMPPPVKKRPLGLGVFVGSHTETSESIQVGPVDITTLEKLSL